MMNSKMILFRISGQRLLSFGLLTLMGAFHLPLAAEQQAGVSLKVWGETIPNNSFVDLDDILYRADVDGFREDPSNANATLHDQALLCVTDLEDCCDMPRTVRGDWYYPNGKRIAYDTVAQCSGSWSPIIFRRNRGPNEIRNGRQFYGSVRLFRRWSRPPQKGRFRCELPSAADPSVNQTLYANIVNFGTNHSDDPVTILASGPSTAGSAFSLTCSAILVDPIPLPFNVRLPSFEWFYGPHGNASLPSGVTPTETVSNNNCITYTSTLQFSPALYESHAGMYTCRLGAGRLTNSRVVSVNVSGVSLKLHGTTIPNNSLVDLEDVLYRTRDDEAPTNARPHLHDGALLCVTDLVDCCDAPRTVRGDWYYPDGHRIRYRSISQDGTAEFLINRGPNEVRNGRQFYGSVRLFHRWSDPPERGHFRCELPSAADPSVHQILYANIVHFDQIILSPSGPSITGRIFSLKCSATLVSPVPLPSDVPSPTFEWFYGPHSNASLPSGVISTPTATSKNCFTYSSTLLFLPTLNESHAGNYTCRLGPGRLASSTEVSVDVGVIHFTPSRVPMLGETGYSLTCMVLTDNLCPTMSYRWTKNNGTTMQLETTSNTLSFSSLRMSDSGLYTCYATISSYTLSRDVTLFGSHSVIIQIPAPTSVMLSSSTSNPVRPIGSTVILTCAVHVELSIVLDHPAIIQTVLNGSAVFMVTNTSQPILGGSHVFTSTAMISSFGQAQSGVYSCAATLHFLSTDGYSNTTSSSSIVDYSRITTGVYLMMRDHFIANNNRINFRSIGQFYDDPNGALQCITDKSPEPDCRHGDWYLPNGDRVTADSTFYTIGGDIHDGAVSLNRHRYATTHTPNRQFCCKVLDAVYVTHTRCVIIDNTSVTLLGSPIAGESYTLEYTMGNSAVLFEWLGPPDGRTPVTNSSSLTINSDSSTSRLQFRPLQQSHSGSYLCRATTQEGAVMLSELVEIRVNAPKISTRITDSINKPFPITGQDYRLFCGILAGAENLNDTITSVSYQWTRNGDSYQIGTGSNTLSFNPIRLSDAANYSCLITIASSYLTGNIITMTYLAVRIQIPTLSYVLLTSHKQNTNSIQTIGSDIMLTCAVKLNPAIQNSEIFLLTIDAQLSRNGTPLPLTGPTVTGTAFTYITHLRSFQQSDFGNYTCRATIRPSPSSTYLIGTDVLSNTLNIKPVILPPLDVQATQSGSSAPVEVSWSPPIGGDVTVTGYRIFYGSGENVSEPTVITSVGLIVDRNYVGEIVFLRSESGWLYSELINVTVESGQQYMCTNLDRVNETDVSKQCPNMPLPCSMEIGIAVGVTVFLMIVAAITVVVTVVLCYCRKKLSNKSLALSANVAYEEVNFKAKGRERGYENVEVVLQPTEGDKTRARSIKLGISKSECKAPRDVDKAHAM